MSKKITIPGTEKLQLVSTYARKKEISTAAVYRQITAEKVPFTLIDGLTFIYVQEEKNQTNGKKQNNPGTPKG